MKAGWEVKPLGEVTSVINGLWKGKKGPYETAKVVRNTNFRPHGQLNLDDVAEIEVEAKQLEKRKLSKGDIVLERSGGGPKQPVGRVVLFDMDEPNFSFSNFTSVIRLTDREKLCPRFLHAQLNFWYAAGLTEQFQKQSTGIRNLDFKAYQLLPVTIPPLEEQNQIVAVLDAVFEGLTRAKENARANLQNARELFEATAIELIRTTDNQSQEVELGELIDFKNGHAFKSTDAIDASNVQLLRMGNLYQNQLDLGRKPAFYPDHFVNDFGKFEVYSGDLVMSLTGTVGKEDYGFVVLIPEIENRLLLNQRIAKVEVKDTNRVDIQYLLFLMRTRSFLEELYTIATGTRQANLSTVQIKRMKIRVPSIQTQRKIVAHLDLVKKSELELVSKYTAKLSDIADLRQSLLQKAFAGELT